MVVGSPTGSPFGCRLGPGTGDEVGVGSGAFLRQIGTFKFGVGVGSAKIDGVGVGRNLGVGVGVGSGLGGTRGSGNSGSGAAAITSVRFQFGPYGAALA